MDDQLEATLARFSQDVVGDFPDMRAIIEAVQAGYLSESDAMGQLMALMKRSPGGTQQLMARAGQTMAPLREPAEQAPPSMMVPGVGLPKVNPLVNAAIAERLQFDGDAPELRTGPIPAGVLPALSVHTAVRDPAVIGRMIRDVALDMQEDLGAHHRSRQRMLESAMTGNSEALAVITRHGGMVTQQGTPDVQAWAFGSPDTDLSDYRRGELPAPVSRATPSGSAIAMLSLEERKESAWHFLSTTQGRRSAISVIRRLVALRLQGLGIQVHERDFDSQSDQTVVMAHKWTINLTGPGATQPSFALMDTAAAVFAKVLGDGVPKDSGPLFLEVATVDALHDREVGWAARLMV